MAPVPTKVYSLWSPGGEGGAGRDASASCPGPPARLSRLGAGRPGARGETCPQLTPRPSHNGPARPPEQRAPVTRPPAAAAAPGSAGSPRAERPGGGMTQPGIPAGGGSLAGQWGSETWSSHQCLQEIKGKRNSQSVTGFSLSPAHIQGSVLSNRLL
nr:cuticle collagen 2-like [Caretta caretta]